MKCTSKRPPPDETDCILLDQIAAPTPEDRKAKDETVLATSKKALVAFHPPKISMIERYNASKSTAI